MAKKKSSAKKGKKKPAKKGTAKKRAKGKKDAKPTPGTVSAAGVPGCCSITLNGNVSKRPNTTERDCRELAESFGGATWSWKPGPC